MQDKILLSRDDVLQAYGRAHNTPENEDKLVDFDLGVALVDILFATPCESSNNEIGSLGD